MPEVPPGAEWLVGMVWDLQQRRPANPFGGLSVISFSEIDAYQRLTGDSLSPLEARLVLAMLDTVDQEIAKEQQSTQKASKYD